MQDNEKDKIVEVIPETGYFRYYYELTKYGEACPRFHIMTAATALGAVVQRKVSFQRSSPDILPTLYPNMWVILVAPQGSGHKSSTIRVARELLNALPQTYRPRILAAKITPEALIKSLASQVVPSDVRLPPGVSDDFLRLPATGLLYSSELGVLIGKEKYNVGFIPLLTELYDSPDEWYSETVMRGNQRLYNVCLSLLGASTPDWLQSMLPPDVFKGGFMSRLLLVTPPPDWNKKVPEPEVPPVDVRNKVLEEMEKIAQIKGLMRWSPESKRLFENWYYGAKEPKMLPGPVVAYLERKQEHLIKLATLIQLTYTYDELILEERTFKQALDILNCVEEDVIPVIEYIATEPRMRGAQLILELLRKHKKIPEHKLVELCWRHLTHPREFQEFISMFIRANIVVARVEDDMVIYEYVKKEEKI